MSGPSEQASIRIAPRAEEVPRLREWLAARLADRDADAHLAYSVQLCAEEIVTNIVTHGYDGEPSGMIDVRLDHGTARTTLVVEDDARPFDPTCVPAPPRPASLATAPIGGLGVHMVRQSSNAMDYARVSGRNRLAVHFDRVPAPIDSVPINKST